MAAEDGTMTRDPLFILAAIACLAVLAVLMVGVGGFARGGNFNKKYANKIMRLRLLLQFIAVILIVAFVYFFRRGS
jgi:Hypoxia induced protein conserved region